MTEVAGTTFKFIKRRASNSVQNRHIVFCYHLRKRGSERLNHQRVPHYFHSAKSYRLDVYTPTHPPTGDLSASEGVTHH